MQHSLSQVKKMAPRAPQITCGWNTSTATGLTMNGDDMIGYIYYYVARSCSTIVLDYTKSYLDSNYWNPLYWEDVHYGVAYWPCFTGCYWEQTVAPPYQYEQHNLDSQQSAGFGFVMQYTDCAGNPSDSDQCPSAIWWSMDLGNLS